VSGTVPTAGATLASISTSDAGGIYAASATQLYIFGSSDSLGTLSITLSGTTLTNAGLVLGSVVATYVFALDAGYAIGVDPTGDNVNCWVQGMSQNFIGFAQSTVSRGASVQVKINGIDSNQTGLTGGSQYLVANGLLTAVYDSIATTTLDDLYLVQALSATEVIKQF
jgi:hypothetical protein